MREVLLQSAIAYFITKCDSFLLQSGAILLQCATEHVDPIVLLQFFNVLFSGLSAKLMNKVSYVVFRKRGHGAVSVS